MPTKFTAKMLPIKMKSKNKILLLTLGVLLLLTGTYTQWQSRPAPELSFRTISNTQIKLKELQGQVVLITFWASNCASCLKEISDFKKLYQNYHKRGLEIIAIAMYYDRPNYVVNTSKAYGIPYDIVLDLDMHLATAFGDVNMTPTTFLLNPKGEIIYQITGLFNLIEMQKLIEAQL